MPSQYGAAQPIADAFGGIGQSVEDALPTPPPWFYKMLGMQSPTPVVDPTWHNQMVQKANQSFQPQAQPEAAMPPRRRMPVR